MFPSDILLSAERVIDGLRSRGQKVAIAESCTGGLLAGAITAIAGSSDVFGWGVVTYADAAKTSLLGVAEDVIKRHGAVSAEVAKAMSEGALARAKADISVAVTGIAGPAGGSEQKPVGLVYIARAERSKATEVSRHDFGDRGRERVRLETVRSALSLLEEAVR